MRSIGRYEILGEIGRGSMGIVYMARQRDLGRLVAIKVLNEDGARIPERTKRFNRESQVGGSFNHRNIVTIYEYSDDSELAYIAMEYVPGGSLRPHVGSLSLAQILGMLEGLLAGLRHVETQIVHRDLKPENVLITVDGQVKIADFGIAKANPALSFSSFATSIGTTVGTPAYMAPEQALSDEVGPWSDLYSVGVIAYEQFVGRVPFHDSKSSYDLVLRRDRECATSVSESRPDLRPALSEWVARLLVRDPAERTRSAAHAWEQLEEIVIEILDPLWRRDAALPSPSQPEVESGFHSYGRAPTGAENKPLVLASESHNEDQLASVHQPQRPQQSVDRQPSSLNEPQQTNYKAHSPARLLKLRYRALLAAVAALTMATGFVIASASEGAKAPARRSGSSSTATEVEQSRAYVVRLRSAVSRLNGVRVRAGVELEQAQSTEKQALAAQRLATAHDQAIAAIRSAVPGSRERAINTV